MPNYSESLPELFKKVSGVKTKDEKIALLQGCQHKQALHTILQGAFHPDVKWELPEGSPPYKKDDSEYGLSPSVLEREVRKLSYFTPFSGKLIQNTLKREEVFIRILESIHPSESELIIQMKDKHVNGLTARLVWEAFPFLIPEPPIESPMTTTRKVSKKKADGQKKSTTKRRE